MKEAKPTVDFFLGTTTPAGFKGYFDTLGTEQENGRQLYLIKSGPGCGKSTLMRRLAGHAQEPVEYIHCSSDPNSLDGIVLCRSGAAVVDATAPHVLEPQAPGAQEQVVSLYHTLDARKLQARRFEVAELFRKNACLRARASRYIGSAGGLLLDSRRAAACSTDFEKVRLYAQHTAERLLPRTAARGSEEIRFLSGITPAGPVFFEKTVAALCARRVVFHDEYGAAARLMLELLRAEALARGYAVIVCRCAMHPDDKIDHLLLPQLGLAFLTSNSWHRVALPGQKNVHCQRFEDTAHLASFKSRLRFNRRAAAELLAQAESLMAQAKSCHDELEKIYTPAVDFAAVDEVGTQLCRALNLAEGEK